MGSLAQGAGQPDVNEDFLDLLAALLQAQARGPPSLGREVLVRNKRASGRAKDLADLEALGVD